MVTINTKRIRNEMNKRDVKQIELCNKINEKFNCDLHPAYINKLLKGKSKSFKTCYFVCNELNIPLDEVYKNE